MIDRDKLLLHPGDAIGLAAPSWLATQKWAQPIMDALENMGFRVKCPRNLFASGWGYAASPEERAADLHELICDSDVRMIFFGGGEGADDVLPLLDWEAASKNPKLWLSYSDGTSILNAVWARTGIPTLYGQMPGLMPGISIYNREQLLRFITTLPREHISAKPWHTLTPGTSQGTLIGGYLSNFIFLAATGRIPLEEGRRYILFIEDNERFNGIESVSALIGRLEQCGILPYTSGLLFGHYSQPVHPGLLQRLKILGEKWNIPAAYCDDFGHGIHHAILPIGVSAQLDTQACALRFLL